MPCSDTHFIPILDELRARTEADLQTQQQSALNPRASAATNGEAVGPISENLRSSAAKKGRGGPRPGSGPPKGNLNALKHGRFSTRHKRLLEALLVVPEARDTLISIAKLNRRRQRKAEVEAAYLLMRWLATNNPDFPASALGPALLPGGPVPSAAEGLSRAQPGENDQTNNDQLTPALARMEEALKRRISRKTTRKRTPTRSVNQKGSGPTSE